MSTGGTDRQTMDDLEPMENVLEEGTGRPKRTRTLTDQGRAYRRTMLMDQLKSALKDLKGNLASFRERLSSESVETRDALIRDNELHLEIVTHVRGLINECISLSDENQGNEVRELTDDVMLQSSQLRALVQRRLLDQEEARSTASSRNSVRTSASSLRRSELRVELAKKKVEMAKAKEISELKAKMDELMRQKEIDCLEAEAKALEDIEREEQNFEVASVASKPELKKLPVRDEGKTETRTVVEMLRRQTAFSTQIKKFNGDPLSFRHFLKSIEDVVERNLEDPRSRLHRLLELVEGSPRDLIDGCIFLDDETCYQEAMRLLKRRYGNNLLVSSRYMEELRAWPPLKDNCVTGFQEFFNALLRCSSVVDKAELDSPRFIGDLVAKLSYTSRNSWRGIAVRIRMEPGKRETFGDFISFIDNLLERASDPVYGEEALKSVASKSQGKTEPKWARPNIAKSFTALTVSTKMQEKECLECSGNHDVEECEIFLRMSHDERKQRIMEHGACFSCLNRGHLSKDCRSRRSCKICGKMHPFSLHLNREPVLDPTESVTTRAVSVGDGVVAMSVVKVWVTHDQNPSCFVNGLALLDPLSSGTFLYNRGSYKHQCLRGYGLAHVSRVGSISLTLSVTIERYYSVCHPLSQFQIKRHLLTISLLFAIVYNIPRFFELSLRGDKPGEYEIVTTDLRRNPYYALLYIFWAKFLLVEMLPYVIMIGLNILIFRRVKQLVKMRSEVGIEPASGAVHQDEIDLAVILLAIVCIFIFCQSFKIIPDIYEVCTCTSTHIRTRACKGTWTIEYIIDMSHCFLALNSSINFFIYIIKGGKFREAILKRFLTIGPRTDVQTRSATNYEMVVNQAPSPPKAHQNVSKADNSDSKDLLEMKPIQDRTIKEESIQNGQDQPDEDVDRNLRWPFLMYDMPTILVEDDEHHKSPRISIYSRKSSSNSHNWFFKRALSSTSKSDTSYNSKSESNSHANDESSNGVSGGSAPFVGNTSSTNLTVTDTGKVSKPSTHIQGGTNQDKDPKMTQNKIVNAHSLVV